METLELIISAAVFLVGILIYFAHDRKLKQQERLINSYQLKQLREEEQANKKADIRAEISQNTKGSRTLRIWNNGRAIARNIRLTGLSVKGLVLMDRNIFPYHTMAAQDSVEIKFLLSESLRELTLTFIWDDEFGVNREKQQTIPL